MITNIWSTPRTGSVWFAQHIHRNSEQPAVFLREPFNPFRYNLYHTICDDGSIISDPVYTSGSFYEELCLDDNNNIYVKRVYAECSVDIAQEDQHRYDVFQQRNHTQHIITQNHIYPIDRRHRDYLLTHSTNNYWLYRKDKRAQLASYAVALSTKRFTSYKKMDISNQQISKCDYADMKEYLARLMYRVRLWDRFDKPNNSTIIAFEDIQFYEQEGLPYNQHSNGWNRLSDGIKHLINELVDRYEAEQNR